MELELSLDPHDAARLPRLALLVPLKNGNARSKPVRIVWHDSPDHGLANEGLALAEQRPLWRLERLPCGNGSWSPGAVTPPLAAARDRAALGHAIPDPLVAIAAFEGRSRTISLACERGPVVLTLLGGIVRSVASEQRVSRVRLEGVAPAVQGLATALAAETHVAVPYATLSAEALAVAAGVPVPEPDGIPDLLPGLSVAAAFAHVVGHLTAVILHFAPAAMERRDGIEPVHQMRVAVRRLRSAIKVFRGAVHPDLVDDVDRDLKAFAAKLAPTRDWDVFVTETCAAVALAFPEEKRLQRLMTAAERRRRACHEQLSAFLASAEFRRLGIELACMAHQEEYEPAVALDEFAARTLNKRLKRLLRSEHDIGSLEPAALHAIRLRAKQLRYAAEIFAPLRAGKPAQRYIRRLGQLQDRLGALNDASVAASLLGELGNGGGHSFATGLVLGFIGARSQRRRDRIGKTWRKFRNATPFWS
jgi:triphosphatase